MHNINNTNYMKYELQNKHVPQKFPLVVLSI